MTGKARDRVIMTSVGDDVVEFWFFRRDVSGVRIVGDFGASLDGGVRMTSGGDGWWRAAVPLEAGEYRFQYVADGALFADYASNGIEVSKAGVNSILVVPERRSRALLTPVAKMVA